MLRIILIRHGETEWNLQRRIMGPEAIPLNLNGQEQSRRMRDALSQISLDAVYSSPILRACETANILCEGRNTQPCLDARLAEVSYGAWVGRTFMEVKAEADYVPYYERAAQAVAPGGESLCQVRDRALDFMQDLIQRHDSQSLAVVSHADWIKCLLMHLLEIPFYNLWKFRVDNASASLLEYEKRGCRVICINQRGDFERLFVSRFSF